MLYTSIDEKRQYHAFLVRYTVDIMNTSHTSAHVSVPASQGNNAASKIRIHQLDRWKASGDKWAMLTVYDYLSAQIFDEAGIPVLLVGDSAANVVYGYETTANLSEQELLFLVKAVARGAKKALIVADMVFGSYESTPQQAFASATTIIREGNAHAVKLEGGKEITPQVQLLTQAGIPVMGHLGFTPQSINTLSGYKVQGKDEDTAQRIIEDAHALVEAGVFAIVLEMVPAELAQQLTAQLPVPTIGIGAGQHTDAQVLVWQDAAGLVAGPQAKFVKRFAHLRDSMTQWAQLYQQEVAAGTYPGPEHSY